MYMQAGLAACTLFLRFSTDVNQQGAAANTGANTAE